jgi:hypothetical protein
MYAAALRALEAGQYQQALEQWGEIHALDPAYPDRQKVATTASKKLKELSKIETPRTSVLARLPVFRIVLFALFGIGLVAVIIYLARPGAVFDDFENKQYDGAYNPEIWGYEYRSDPNRGVIAQQDGVLSFTSDGAVNVLELHLLQAFKKPLKAGTVIETRLRVDESSAGAHIGFGFTSDAYGSRGAACQIQAAGESLVHCWVDISGTSRDLPIQVVPPGTWHKLSIEIVELEPLILNFYADDKQLGQIVTENINDIGEQQFNLGFLLHSITRGHNQGYVDDVYYGPRR